MSRILLCLAVVPWPAAHIPPKFPLTVPEKTGTGAMAWKRAAAARPTSASISLTSLLTAWAR